MSIMVRSLIEETRDKLEQQYVTKSVPYFAPPEPV